MQLGTDRSLLCSLLKYLVYITASTDSSMGEVRIPIVDNNILERDEYFIVRLMNSVSRVIATGRIDTTITIVDDDGK